MGLFLSKTQGCCDGPRGQRRDYPAAIGQRPQCFLKPCAALTMELEQCIELCLLSASSVSGMPSMTLRLDVICEVGSGVNSLYCRLAGSVGSWAGFQDRPFSLSVYCESCRDNWTSLSDDELILCSTLNTTGGAAAAAAAPSGGAVAATAAGVFVAISWTVTASCAKASLSSSTVATSQ